MPSWKVLRCHTKHRLQRLLWTPEYESYMNLGTDEEPIVLVESPFVVETKSDDVDKMVYVCLTTESLLIGEENLKAKHVCGESLEFYDKPDMTTACRKSADGDLEGDWDLQDFRLKYLFPLQHVRLSVRQYREKQGEHVLRLRIGEDTDHLKTWYLELAGRHREVVWRWWREWIEELEERRKEQRHRLKMFKKKIKSKADHTDVESVEFGELNLDWHRDIHGMVLFSTTSKIEGTDDSNRGTDESLRERREKLKAWHIEEHKKRFALKHPEKRDSTLDFLYKDTTEADIISRCTQYGIPIPTSYPPRPSLYSKIGLPVPESLDGGDDDQEVNSCSSLEDILSVGSLVDSDIDWQHAVSTQVNDRLVLCVGDLFEKSNVEIHGHGHMARVRPMASDTALTHLLEFEETNLAIDDKHHTFVGIDKEELHHTNSVPDVLEGEAAFLEDDYEASQVTHRTSFVAIDVGNENTDLQAHIINGHVLLVTKKEMRMEKELIRFREDPHDLDFTTCKHKGKSRTIAAGGPQKTKRLAGTVQKYKDAKKKKKASSKERGANIGSKLKHKLHLGEGSRPNSGSHKAVDFFKQNVLMIDDVPPWAVDLPDYFTITSWDIPPEALARELTLIDKELFLMIHESELVDCMWMKHDKHSKAPNVLKAIEFFERVVRTVSAEIVKRNYDWARAKAMAYFTRVAEKCLELQNFHSLKAVLCGIQVPSIYRLKHSWSDFEELHPDEYNLFLDLGHLMADDGCSAEYFVRLEMAETKPPYLPFLGAFLKSLTSIFTVIDEGGMRKQHKQKKAEANVEEDEGACCSSAAARGICYHSDDDEADDEEVENDPFGKMFEKVNAKNAKKKDPTLEPERTQRPVVQKSPAYLMNETLFHYQIAALQYKWIDLPQVREFWLRNRLPDEVEIWKMSREKEDLNSGREERAIRMARKAKVEEEFKKRQQRVLMREKLAKEAAKTVSIWGNLSTLGKKSPIGKKNTGKKNWEKLKVLGKMNGWEK